MDVVGANTTIWKYFRAKDSMLFELIDVEFFANTNATQNIYAQLYEGHTYSKWGSFSSIFDQSTLRLAVLDIYGSSALLPLYNFITKEITISFRNDHLTDSLKVGCIIYFNEINATVSELAEYAVKQPKVKLRKSGPSTLTEGE